MTDSIEDATNDVWTYVESNAGDLEPVGLEVLGEGHRLARDLETGVTAVLAGSSDGLKGLADIAISYGADRVIAIEDPLLDGYRPETYERAVGDVVEDARPRLFLVGATHNGIDLAGQLAVRLGAGMNADVIRLEIDEEGDLVGGVPAFAGGILAMVKAPGSRPQMSTVRPGVFNAFEPDRDRSGAIDVIEPGLDPGAVVTEVEDREVTEGVDLPGADVVVAAGRGAADDLAPIERLADALDATIGVTRPLCDEGLLPRDHQIGTTGYSLQAEVAIVAGVSGAVHFTGGIDDVETVIAINVDRDEPIFEHADYCLEGDLYEVIPAILEALEGRQEALP